MSAVVPFSKGDVPIRFSGVPMKPKDRKPGRRQRHAAGAVRSKRCGRGSNKKNGSVPEPWLRIVPSELHASEYLRKNPGRKFPSNKKSLL
jgi:hypothetical protein